MAVKKNIFIDITFLITFMTFFVYTSGNAYIGGFTRYFGYKEGALGLTLQEYFMFGGLNGLSGIFLIFFSLLCISLINVLCDKNIHISMLKGALYAILFPFLFTYNWIKHYYIIPPKILVGILYYKQKIKEKFKRKSSDRFSIKILLNIISDQTHNIIKKSINWDSKVDFKNIDQGVKEVIRYYFYLIILYLVIISILFFFIDMEKTGLHDAKERIQIEDHELPIKDEIIDMHLNKIYKNIPYPLKGKVLECGTTNCLVAINVENFIYKGKSPQIHKKYIVKPIKNDGYINQINSFQDLPEI